MSQYMPSQEGLSMLGFPSDAWRGIVVATSENPRGFTAWTIYARETHRRYGRDPSRADSAYHGEGYDD